MADTFPWLPAQVSPAYRAHFGDSTYFDLSYDMVRPAYLLRERVTRPLTHLHRVTPGRAEGAAGGP